LPRPICPASLALVLSAALVEASADLRNLPAGDLQDRFVGAYQSQCDDL
jgi:hypothetical protein